MGDWIVEKNIGGECFIESGVKYGSASVVIAKSLKEKGYLFDTWTNLPHFGEFDAHNSKRKVKLRKRMRQGKNTYKECVENLTDNGVKDLCTMIKGDICKTIPEFIKENKEKLSISLIHSDSDIYDPTKVTLESLWPYLVEGGMILVHDYDVKQWPGIKVSVDGFLSDKQGVHTMQFYKNVTACFLIMKDSKNTYEVDFNNICNHVNKKFPHIEE